MTYRSYSGSLVALQPGAALRLQTPGGDHDVVVANVRPFKTGGIVQFKNVDLATATTYRGAQVFVRRSQLGELGRGEVYVADLIGLRALMPDGQTAGIVQDAVDTQPVTLIIAGPFAGTVPYHADWVADPDFAAGTVRLLHPPIA